MADSAPLTPRLRFGAFELDPRSRELRKFGVRVRLGVQPFQILLMLVEHPGEAVLREEIQQRLWPNNTIVEFDHGINAAIQKLRDALGESADKPRHIETVGRRGYRFLGEVEVLGGKPPQPVAPAPPEPIDTGELTGKVLSHYRILEKLGSGGTGVVYRAEDLKLGRHVALKFLHGAPGERPAQVVRRFEREARAASALNHPNVCIIHGLEDPAGQRVIVMELVEGETLAARLRNGPLPLDQALTIAIAIADALTEAHSKDVTHRDVKPSNVMLTRSGVKVLDFGLAKTGPSIAASDDPATLEGAILGTASYMSPEQAEGKTIDPRSDIFSFGAVLYEMTTGQRAFRGETIVSILSAILRDEPKPASEFAAAIPSELDKIITRCLGKDPARRYQNTTDLRVALSEVQEELESGRAPTTESVRVRKPTRRWASVAAMIVALLGTALWLMKRGAAPLPPPSLVHVTAFPGSEKEPSFSPDGKQIAFSWDGEKGDKPSIYVKLLGETNALRLTTSPTADNYPAWAPDGKRIVFRRQGPSGGIYVVSALGGAERKLSAIDSTYAMSWSPDGKWLAISLSVQDGGGISLLPFESGEPRRISDPKPPVFNRAPAFAPGGRRLAYAACSGSSCDVYLQELDSGFSPQGLPRRITRQGGQISGLTWNRDERSLIYSASLGSAILPYLWRADIDGRQAPQRLEIAGPYANAPSASPTADRVVFSRTLQDFDIWRYRVAGGMEPLIVSSLQEDNPQFSPDGTKIAFESNRSGDTEEIWVAQADGAKPVQITNRLGRHQGTPRWSPDGRWIAFDSQGQDGYRDVYVMDAAGTTPRRITFEPSDESMPFWSRDGKWLYFRSDRTGRNEIWRIPFAGGPPEQVTRNGGYGASESVDGKTLFYMKSPSGPLFARLLSGGEEHKVLDYVALKAFVPVAEGIYYIGRRTDGQYPLEFLEFSGNTSRLLEKIDGLITQGMSVSSDEKSILFSRSVTSGADLMMIENFQ